MGEGFSAPRSTLYAKFCFGHWKLDINWKLNIGIWNFEFNTLIMQQLDLKTLSLVIGQIAEEKGIPQEKVIEVIEMALASAYKKDYGRKEEKYRARFNKETGKVDFFLVKKVVDEGMLLKEGEKEEKSLPEGQKKLKFNPYRHIMINEVPKIRSKISYLNAKPFTSNAKINPGDEIELSLPKPEKFGRIAAQTAKQVLLQKIKETEKEITFTEFSRREGEILSGIIQRKEGETVFVDLGRAVGILLKEEQIPNEFYKIGSRMRFYLLKVKEAPRGPEIYLSRAHPKFLSKLFEIEVPEISSGTVEIKSVAREPGFRSKIAVASKEEGVDPVGSCVGAKGTRVNAVMQELGREKIDIILWDKDPKRFIENALAPAKACKVKIEKNKAIVEVPKDQLSLAIGKNGQNVRLASELTGWKIDVIEAKQEK